MVFYMNSKRDIFFEKISEKCIYIIEFVFIFICYDCGYLSVRFELLILIGLGKLVK